MSPTARPRIALVVPTFPKLSETFIVRHLVGLYDRGWDVHVLCRRLDREALAADSDLSRRPGLASRLHLEPVVGPRWRLAARAPRLVTGWLRRPHLARRVAACGLRRLVLDATLARLEPDLVHFEFGSLAVDRIAAVRRLGPRAVVSFRGFDLNYVGLENPDHYAPVWRHADALHLLGRDLWRRARGRGCPADKARILIPPAVDSERFEPAPTGGARRGRRHAGPLRLLSVGRLEWKKGHEYALRAVRRLLDTGVEARLEIVGDGAMLGPLAFLRHQLGLDGDVELVGALEPADLRRRLEAADVFLHMAVSEGFCNAVLEAQAMGLPVVASDADGLAENVADGDTGLIVPRRDPAAAARALVRLAEDPDERRRFGIAGRRRVMQEFTPGAEIDAFEHLYHQVLAAGPRPTGELAWRTPHHEAAP